MDRSGPLAAVPRGEGYDENEREGTSADEVGDAETDVRDVGALGAKHTDRDDVKPAGHVLTRPSGELAHGRDQRDESRATTRWGEKR